MAIDVKDLQAQLMGTFFEETFESIELLERGLLALEGGADAATINDIFRAAHSIKGAAGTFGFGAVTELAHDMETLLDAIRAGAIEPDAGITASLLEAVDVLRQVLVDLRDGGPGRSSAAEPLRRRLQEAVPRRIAPSAPAKPGEGPVASSPVKSTPAQPAEVLWHISFAPRSELLESGNEPWRLFRELALLGSLEVECDASRLPALSDLQPTRCYLSWRLRLRGATSRAAIDDVFAWVTDDCDLEISAQEAASPALAAALPEAGAAQAPAVPAPAGAPTAATGRRDDAETSLASLRVGVDKIDFLMNMVGELVITQSMLGQLDDGPVDERRLSRIREGLSQLARNSRALQESVMRLRSMPISVVFNRFPRLVHDLSKQLGKRVELEVVGQGTELDKTVLEKLGDPLVHLVRNSLDHGLESPAERRAAGKPETGKLSLAAFHRGGDIVIEVRDDGRGLDRVRILQRARERGLVAPDQVLGEAEIVNLIFAPGFSTAAAVTDVSGRGVGMDVVRRNVKSLGGHIGVESPAEGGTKVTLRLPLTLAIVDGQLVRIGDRPYVVPLLSIVESVQIDPKLVKRLNGQWDVYRLRDQLIPIVDSAEILGVRATATTDDRSARLLVIVEGDGQRLGLLVEELQGQQQVVIKSLEANFGRVPGLAGATILGDGGVAFILDIAGLSSLARQKQAERGSSIPRRPLSSDSQPRPSAAAAS